MGLLDQFANMTPDQSQGLLAAAAQILQKSGDPRRPFGLGQALGTGIEAYQANDLAARKRKMDEAQAAQMGQMRAMQIQGLQSQQEQQKASADAAARNRALIGAQGPNVDYQGLIRQGVPFDMVKQLADSRNLGRDEVSGTSEIEGPNGQKIIQPYDKYGAPVGAGRPGYIAPVAVNRGGSQDFVKPVAGLSLQRTMTPGEAASIGMQRARLAFDKEQQGGDSNFTPDAISNAAARYNIDGTLPPMGMGKTGAAGRAAILNKAAELANSSGLSGDEQRIQQIGNKANSAALSKLQQQQTMVGAFEKNFNRNADIALEYSQKVDRTGIPIANKWINAGKRSIGGDPELAAFDASVKAASNEYAKIISGSMGNTATAEGEIKKIESLLNSAQTPQQVASVINLMKRETANRMRGFDEEKASLRSGMSGKSGAPKRAEPAQVQIPQAAAAMLKMNPALRAQFDQKYGQGAAASVLGQ